MSKKILVVGGGAAGMMAAITAAEHGGEVSLLEPNERLGKKLNITGKGRCNVTNNAGSEELLAHVAKNGRFLYSAFSRFDGRDTMRFFESLGVPLKTERGNRVFPVSDRSFDISGALEKRMRALHIQWIHDKADALLVNDGAVSGVAGEKQKYEADAVILATGGVSYPATGSTGDGYRMAQTVGHTLVPAVGSLVPLVSDDPCCAAMQGLALKNIQLTVHNQKKKVIYQDFGELLFTHFGLSGPLILSASAHLQDFEKNSYTLSIDLKPALDEKKLEARILRDMDEKKNQNFSSLVAGLVAHSMIPVVVERCGVDGETKVNSVTREARKALEMVLKQFTVPVTGKRPVEEAIVTSGGVKVGEINPNTMESKLVKRLYFAGEILDVDAYTGGFNLQIAWATGRAAGEAAAAEENKSKGSEAT
ncbi:MAG: NAD(P)/FAD-dependent oxidoreductase [Oscillibacter sp.]|jgi:predicted Rossmann fold flavoprotein|nr:NAD(P)/FAD-dependent oxidoreductase [Oscillibacter sp.]